MTKFAKTYSPSPAARATPEDMERIMEAEAKRLAAILDVSPASALQSLKNLIAKGLVTLV